MAIFDPPQALYDAIPRLPSPPSWVRDVAFAPLLGRRLDRAGDARRYEHPAGDPGLFGPDSAVWRVHGQVGTVFVAAPAALVLQTLHPKVAAGVADHSSYRTDPHGRAERTGRYIADTTWGSTPLAEAALTMLERVHARVRGSTPTGEPYDAADPELVTFVNSTQAYALLHARRRFGWPPVTAAVADRYVDEMATLALRLGGSPPPRNATELDDYVEALRPTLLGGDQADRIIRSLLTPPRGAPPAQRVAAEVIVRAAMDVLPRWAAARAGKPVDPIRALAVPPVARLGATFVSWFSGAPPEERAARRRLAAGRTGAAATSDPH